MRIRRSYIRAISICVFFVHIIIVCEAQVVKKTSKWVLHQFLIDTTRPGHSSFRIYPTLAFAPETDLEIGLSSLYLFQAKKDTNNRISELNAFTFFTVRSQYGFWFDNAVYGDQDKWFILGKIRFQRFPLLYYGIGPHTDKHYPATIDANYFIFRQRLLRKIFPNLFIGPEVDYQNLFNPHVNHDKNDEVKEFPPGSEGSGNMGIGGAIIYDNRHNVLNVRKGLFFELGLLNYSGKAGSKYPFTGINTDIRGYRPIHKRDVLALQLTGNFYAGKVPFNQMALMGGESMMRGYYYGRYRDKNMVAGQAEYRILPFSFIKRVGATMFASTAVVAPAISDLSVRNLKFAGGAGLRYLLFPKKDIFMRFDLGITKEGRGYYFFIGEAF